MPNNDSIGNDTSRDKEIRNVELEQSKVRGKEYFSMIDDIIQLNDLISLIEKQNNKIKIGRTSLPIFIYIFLLINTSSFTNNI